MDKKLDPVIVEALKKYGFGPEACWNCHGVWVVYHRALEQIAAKAGIKFSHPTVLEANGIGKSVAIWVEGKLGSNVEWSIGEAAPGNNKNSYPYAMAEKRAKDRVVLKLIGIHGLAYSEDEIDERGPEPAAVKQVTPAAPAPKSEAARIEDEIMAWQDSETSLLTWYGSQDELMRRTNRCTEAERLHLQAVVKAKRTEIRRETTSLLDAG